METWIGCRCPVCGAVLIDEKDVRDMRAFYNAVGCWNGLWDFVYGLFGIKTTKVTYRIQTNPDRKRSES